MHLSFFFVEDRNHARGHVPYVFDKDPVYSKYQTFLHIQFEIRLSHVKIKREPSITGKREIPS